MSTISYLIHNEFDILKILLNITLLFGFIAPGEYINIGAWSIGNECVYYAFTPLLIYFYTKSKFIGNFAVFITILIGCFFSFHLLSSDQTLAQQWNIYINPFNNFFLYACGLALYYNFHDINMKYTAYFLIALSLLILTFFPIYGDQINIVTNIPRIIFSIAAIALTLGFYKLEINLPHWVSNPFANLGEATYGVYLLHPIVFIFTKRLFSDNPYFIISSTVLLTIIFANITYKLYEKPFIKIGKKLTS